MSSASSSSSSRVIAGSPRRASAERTCCGEARSSLRSITALLLGETGREAAVAAVLVDQNLEVQASRGRVHRQHVQLGVERHRGAEYTDRGPGAYQHHGAGVEGERLVEHVLPGGGERDRRERRGDALQSRQGAEVERLRWKQSGLTDGIEIEREVERGRLVGAHG